MDVATNIMNGSYAWKAAKRHRICKAATVHVEKSDFAVGAIREFCWLIVVGMCLNFWGTII